MLEFLIASIFSCADATGLIVKVSEDPYLTDEQKVEIVEVLIEHSDCNRNANVD